MRYGLPVFPLLLTALLMLAGFAPGPAWGAIGCDLTDPDRDVKKFFPNSTGYKTVSLEIQKVGGNALLGRIEAKLRDRLRGLYETIDVPYTIYVIQAKGKMIGYIHGVDQRGRYGAIEIFLSLSPDERIKTFYIQKMSGPHAGKFREAEFGKQFVGLTLDDFEHYEVASGKATGKMARIKNPAPEAEYDFKYIMRGTKKNLILVNEFIKMAPELSARNGAPAQ